MDLSLTQFTQALRSAELEVSPAETLDAFTIVAHVGIRDRQLLHDSLGLALAKSVTDKAQFSTTFDAFYRQLGATPNSSVLPTQLLQAIDQPQLIAYAQSALSPDAAQLVNEVLHADRDHFALRLARLANQPDIDLMGLRNLRDRSAATRKLNNALGVNSLQQESERAPDAVRTGLTYVLHQAKQETQTYVDQQYALRVDARGNQALVQQALDQHLARIPPSYQQHLLHAATQMAQKLAKARRKRLRRAHRGQLDVRRLLRLNLRYDGTWVHIPWRKTKYKKPKVFVVCDVSNSVSNISRFLLTFLYTLQDVLPSVRAFAFSSELGEVTSIFRDQSRDVAVENAIREWGAGSTDYGSALLQLRSIIRNDLDRNSTLIFLGDARNNYFPAQAQVLAELAAKAKCVYWLNPEAKDQWGEGDSLMQTYNSFCLASMPCNRLRHIERFANKILR